MWLEVTVFTTNVLYILFLALQKRVGWVFGIIGSALFVWSNIEQQLYMDASLNFYYVLAGLYGWWLWGREGKEGLSISKLPGWWILWITVLSILLISVFGIMLHQYTHSNISYLDATVTILSFIATWLAARKVIENWLLWLIADPLAIWLYLLKGDKLYAALFLLYTGMAAYGYYHWRKQMNQYAA